MTRFDGADLSHHQDDAGPIDWPTLRAASAGAWVATKATQGLNYVDPTCDTHRAQMGAQGFTHRGLYHWLSFNTDPVAQAAHFLDCVGTLHPGEFAMLDAEEGGITVAGVLAWCRAVEAATHRPCAVYTGAYVAGGTIWQNTAVRSSDYGPRPMHLAAYTTEAKALALPGVKAYPWSAWQYSSNGPVPGVTGRCDMNRIDIVAHFDLAAGITEPNPQPEDDMKIVTNSETHTLPPPPVDSGATGAPNDFKWLAGLKKRHLSQEEWEKVYASDPGVALSNAALDEIPTDVGGDTVDTVARNRIDALNDSVGRVGQSVGDIQSGLIKAGGG